METLVYKLVKWDANYIPCKEKVKKKYTKVVYDMTTARQCIKGM